MTERDIITAAYNAGVDEEYNRLISSPLFEAEFDLITRCIEKYLSTGAVVIDIGAGPGRYAEFLLQKKCHVGLVDLSEKSLEAFNLRIDETLNEKVLFTQTACATDLGFIGNEVADAVLLMGPLYHLTQNIDRQKALSEACRILKNGGYLFAIFMSTFDHHTHHHCTKCNGFSDSFEGLLKDAVTVVNFQGYDVPQYRCLPEVAVHTTEPLGFGTIKMFNIEGLGIHYSEKDLLKFTGEEAKQALFQTLRKNCESPEMTGIANQFLYVGKKSKPQ